MQLLQPELSHTQLQQQPEWQGAFFTCQLTNWAGIRDVQSQGSKSQCSNSSLVTLPLGCRACTSNCRCISSWNALLYAFWAHSRTLPWLYVSTPLRVVLRPLAFLCRFCLL